MKTPLTSNQISCLEFFNINWSCWALLGLKVPRKERHNKQRQLKRYLYIFWMIVVNVYATCLFPIHFIGGIFQSETQSQLFDSIAISITSIGAAGKLVIIAMKVKKIREMEAVIGELDARVTHKEELEHYWGPIRRNIINIQRVFVAMYLTVGMATVARFLFRRERSLFYGGWLPFDWRASSRNYFTAIVYQIIGIFLQFMQTFSNDSFPPKALCVLSAHIKLLYKRVARIGRDDDESTRRGSSPASLLEQEKELNRCVLDQINLYKLYSIIQDIVSWTTFLQIFASVCNNCVAVVALLFSVTDIFERIYYSLYIVGMTFQLFPTCYYGSDFVQLFEQLHYAVFSCNWIGQSPSFKRHMILFTERSLRPTVAFAGGMFPIHLDTFFAACKGAYSLFAVVMTVK